MLIKVDSADKLGDYAAQLGRSGFNLPDSLLKLMPKWWLDLRIKKSKRKEVLDRYALPDNYPMDIPVNNDKRLDKLPILKSIDAAHRKAQMLVKDILMVNFALVEELLQEDCDLQHCLDMAVDSTMLAIHAAGSAQKDRVKSLEKKITGTASLDDGVQSIVECVDLEKAAKVNKVNKELGPWQRGGQS